MKKLSVFFAFLLVAAVTFVGCKKDEEVFPAPSITFSGGDAGTGTVELDFATTASISKTFVVQVAAEGEINAFTLSKKVYGTSTISTPVTITGDFAGKTSFDYTFNQTFTATDFDNVTKIEYIFTVTDKQATPLTAEKIFTVTKKAIPAGTPFGTFSSYSTVTLGAQNATLGSSFASSSNSVYTLSQAATNSSSVDFCYFYGANNLATLAAPSNADAQTVFTGMSSWTTKNNTLFVKNPSGINFSTLSTTTDISSVTFATDTKANNLVVGDLVAFKTATNKIGFAKVTTVGGSNSTNIIFDVKVQQ